MSIENSSISFIRRQHKTLWVATFALLATFIVSQQIGGETWDERAHAVGHEQLISIATRVIGGERDVKFEDMAADLEFYGVLPAAPASIVTSVVDKFSKLDSDKRDALFRFALHFSAFCWGVGTAGLLYFMVLKICGDRRFALLGAGFLMLYPAWLGHSFFNYKDLAMAFFFMLALYGAIVAASTELAQFRRGVMIVGLASIGAASVKLPGIAILIVQWCAVGLAALQENERRKRIRSVFLAATLVVAGTYIVSPAGWLEPIRFAIESVTYLSRHLWSGCTLTMGECLSPSAQGWSTVDYLALWLMVRLPVVILLVAVPAALFLLVAGGKKERIVVAATFVPITLIIIRNSTLYDGIRHILFFLPPLFAVVTLAVARLALTQKILSRIFQYAMIANIGAFVVDNVMLFPYNYVYFNEATRQYATPSLYDLEYWGFSLHVAMDLLKTVTADRENESLRYYAYPSHLASPFAKANYELMESPDTEQQFYWVSITRRNSKPDADCEIVSEVSRSLNLASTPLKLAFVAECK